jgi:hypothetical protein
MPVPCREEMKKTEVTRMSDVPPSRSSKAKGTNFQSREID